MTYEKVWRTSDPLLDHLGVHRQRLPEVRLSQRLVPVDFTYGEDQVRQEVLRAMEDRRNFSGYPVVGLRMSEKEYRQWVEKGRPVEALVGRPGDRPAWFVGWHANRNVVADGWLTPRLKNSKIEDYRADGSKVKNPERFIGLELCSDGSPLHPFFHDAVTSQYGIPTGAGFYWFLGPNEAADPVIMRVKKGKLQVVLVERSDGGGLSLPGGMLDTTRPGWAKGGAVAVMEETIAAAQREAREETGIVIEDLSHIAGVAVFEKFVVGDFRLTAQAWPVTSEFLFVPKPATAEVMVPQAADDARVAQWMGVGGGLDWKGITQEVMFASHASYLKLAVLKFEKLFGVVVRDDGAIGKAE